jgi:hypothetical protein
VVVDSVVGVCGTVVVDVVVVVVEVVEEVVVVGVGSTTVASTLA